MSGRREDWLVGQLPQAMLAEDFFVRFVSLFQAQAETLVQHADNLEHLADRDLTPEPMIRFMSQWLGLPGIDGSFAPDAQRRILGTAAATLQWRGTRRGIARLLELYSGAQVTIEESGGVYEAGEAPAGDAWVRLSIESTGPLEERDLVRLVLDEVPAHVHVEIAVGGRVVWPAVEDGHEAEVEGELAS
jgi:phage tail-like protein